jgi:hypothetical protein
MLDFLAEEVEELFEGAVGAPDEEDADADAGEDFVGTN